MYGGFVDFPPVLLIEGLGLQRQLGPLFSFGLSSDTVRALMVGCSLIVREKRSTHDTRARVLLRP